MRARVMPQPKGTQYDQQTSGGRGGGEVRVQSGISLEVSESVSPDVIGD